MPEDFGFKRFPTVEKKISEISPEDIRVAVIGTVVDKGDGKIVIDDGSDNINVFLDDENKLETGKLLRIVGRVNKDDLSISAEAVQDFSKFNLELYKKLKELYLTK